MQKRKTRWMEFAVLTAILIAIGYMYYTEVTRRRLTERKLYASTSLIQKMRDSLDGASYANYYLTNQFTTTCTESNAAYNLRNVALSVLEDGEPKGKGSLGAVLGTAKRKLIVRYTEIGCNSCADSTMKAISRHAELRKHFDIVFLVDFSNYDAYLKWKKIAEIEDPIYWVKKGQLPFSLEKLNDSYLFTLDRTLKASNFFVPNSRLPYYINVFLEHVSRGPSEEPYTL